MNGKPTIPEVASRFAAYRQRPGNEAWGSLHLVMDDGNVDDASVTFARENALENEDVEGATLADLLIKMSKTQRKKLPAVVAKTIA